MQDPTEKPPRRRLQFRPIERCVVVWQMIVQHQRGLGSGRAQRRIQAHALIERDHGIVAAVKDQEGGAVVSGA